MGLALLVLPACRGQYTAGLIPLSPTSAVNMRFSGEDHVARRPATP